MPPASVWVNALVISSMIVMMASGLVLLYSIMGILNWSHGQLYMLGAFAIYYLYVSLGLNYFIALPIAAIAVAVVGMLIERCLLRPVADEGFMPASVISLGLIFALEGLVTISCGYELKSVPSVMEGIIHVGPVYLSIEKSVLIGMAAAIMLSLYVLINRTRLGLAIRAAAQEPTVAGLYGVHSARLFTIVMGIGCALAGLAGGMIAPAYFVDPYIGAKPLITALLSIVLGGLGSLKGSVVGGLIFGLITSVGAYYVGPWHELISFLAVIIIILFRPQGIFGMSEARM